MRLGKVLFLLVLVANVANAGILDNLNRLPPNGQEVCKAGEASLSSYVAQLASDRKAELNSYSTETVYYTNAANNGSYQEDANCNGAQGLKYDVYNKTCPSNGDPCFWYKNGTQYISVNHQGTKVLEETCPPQSDPDYDVDIRDDQGNVQCFSRADIAAADTCPDSAYSYDSYLPVGGNTEPSICYEKSDGSRCSYALSDDGTYYQNTFEHTHCYQTGDYDFQDTTLNDNPSGQQCYEIATGLTACTEDPQAQCLNGVCNEGCGYIGLNGQDSMFVCLGSDTDSDGVYDYEDPDIDGDGIPNDEDLDSDGDGVDDPTNGIYSNFSFAQIEPYLQQLVQNTSNLGGSGGSSGGSSQAVVDSLEEIKDSFTVTDCGENCGSIPTTESAQLEIDAAELELQAVIDGIKLELDTMFAIDPQTANLNPCFNLIQWAGETKQVCLADHPEAMSLISAAILFLFGVISVVIFFR